MPQKPQPSRLVILTDSALRPGALDAITKFLHDELGIRAGAMLSWDAQSGATLALIEACKGFLAFHPEDCPDPDCPSIAARAALKAVGHDPDDEGIRLNWPGQ